MTLHDVFDRQRRLQDESFGIRITQLGDEERAEFVRSQALALIDEVSEALDEVRWKPWQFPRGQMDSDAFGRELVDALHFLVNLWLVAGWEADDVIAAYQAKAEVNANRQAVGYDGVSDKCSSCGRATDEPS
jgi:dimeric dUTPase (all-alpha-NTP-PPase superfamily)